MGIGFVGPGEISAIADRLFEQNSVPQNDFRLYVQITRGVAPRRHAFPPPDTPPTIYCEVGPLPTHPEDQEEGAAAITTADQRWARCDIKSIALLPNVLANQRAVEAGAREAIFVKDGMVTEGTHNSVLGVVDGIVRTAPLSNQILASITRGVVLDICDDVGVPVAAFPMTEAEMRGAEELFLAGTTAEVTPVVQLDGRPISDGKPGPVTRRLQHAFRSRTRTTGL
jgi:D-alanine transaminase